MGRAAQLWKSQEALTEGFVNEKLSVQEQLQVRIALRMMRKSHTKTAKSEAERKRLKKQGTATVVEHIGEPNYSSVQDDTVQIRSLEDIMKEAKNNFNLTKDKRKMDKASTRYGQLRPIFPHLVEEIRIEQEELQRLRDEREENEVDSMGSADADGKRISRPSRAIMNAQKRKLSRRPHSAGGKHASITNAQKMLASKEAPGKLGRGSMVQNDGEGADRNRMLSKASLASVDALHNVSSSNYRRQELVPIRSTEVLSMNAEAILAASEEQAKAGRPAKELQQHLQNAQQMTGDTGNSPEFNAVGSVKMKTSSSTKMRGGVFGSISASLDVLHEHDEHTVGSGSVHLSRDDPREAAERMAALYRTNSPSPSSSERCLSPSQMLMRQNSSNANLGNLGEDSFFGTTGRPLALLRQMSSSKRSSFFSSSAVKDDERISRAQQQRDDIQKLKEDELRQRIRNKELLSLSKAEMMVYEQRQRAWAIAVVALARWSLLSETLTKHRTQQEMWETNKATKKAIGFIERWWRRGRVRMIIKRNPHVVPLIRRVIMPLVVRLRLARKRRSANLIVTFLQDSTGMSETMRAIYAFRQTAIRLQRWIKSWIEVQHCRMRILWLKCERMYRERARAEGDGKKTDNVPVLPHVNMFAGTADELGTKKRQLARLLEDQENARLARVEEARFQEEILQKKKKAEEDRITRYQKLKHIKKNEHKGHKKGTSGGLNQQSVGGDSTAQASSAAMSLVSALPAYLLNRTVIKKAQAPWHKRIRTSASNIKIYDLLREVLKYERRRHVLNLVQHKRRGDECLVGTAELKKFLRNPHGYDGVTEISKKLAEVQVIARSPAQMYKTPFLLLTQGGIESMEMLLVTNRYIKF